MEKQIGEVARVTHPDDTSADLLRFSLDSIRTSPTCTESGGGTTKASEEGSFIFADVSFETSADYDTYQYQGENVAPAINGMMNPARWGGVDADGTTDTDIYPSSVFTCDEAETDGFSDAYAPSSKYRGTYVFEAPPGLKSVFLPAPSGRNGWEWMVPAVQ
ncbi:hypothetical protein CH261_10245 [Rhodococcus sp. 05-2254-3]|nr:hypothetical protein CH261_10245 [Rhodococcus sp. 05-2254-3]